MSRFAKKDSGKKIVRSGFVVTVLIALAVLVTACAGPRYRDRGHHHYMDDTVFNQDKMIKYDQGRGDIF
jgi:hypothetical protein